jgi:sulfatase maturation enzyme AslB (radical SAM superfamily)
MSLLARQIGKFVDPRITADGEERAVVAPTALKTLWLNTGTLCNVTCENCYIESSPSNDRLSYLPLDDVLRYLDEIRDTGLPVEEIGVTGGEPFMNPDIIAILESCLSRGHDVLVLTNAMRPMMKVSAALKNLRTRFPERLTLRVSVDHFDRALHEEERGARTWAPAMEGLRWLHAEGFRLSVAGRTRWGETEAELRQGYERLFASLGLDIDAHNVSQLVLFPEMDETAEVPEITTACWDILGVQPGDIMCASSRMVVRRKGAVAAEVVSCTLLPYSEAFSMGRTLTESLRPIALNHPHCARFCVLGGGSCSSSTV